jgi:hypothetical protein
MNTPKTLDEIAKRKASEINSKADDCLLTMNELSGIIKAACLEYAAATREQLDEAKAELAKLKEDKDRLDWIDAQCFTNRENEREIHFDFKGDMRQAIDAARKKQSPEPLPTAFIHYAGCPALNGKPVCTCGAQRKG